MSQRPLPYETISAYIERVIMGRRRRERPLAEMLLPEPPFEPSWVVSTCALAFISEVIHAGDKRP